MKKILVLCTGNSCRSQIAEGYLRLFAKDKAEIYSAGVETHGVNPRALQIMKEDGVDISKHTSNNVNEYNEVAFDFVITVCDNAKERCPVLPSKAQQFHYNFPDPAKATGTEHEILQQFREVRNMIKKYSREFVERHLLVNYETTMLMNSEIKRHWENVYETKQSNEVSWTQQVPQPSLDFIHSLHIPKTASIIDIGGGESRLVDFLLAEGYQNITVLDISQKALEKAQQRLGEKAGLVKWIVSDITEFEPPQQYDVWHDRATFHFLTVKEDIEKYLSIAKRSIKGYLIIGTFSLSGPKKCSGLEIKQYSEEQLENILANGFTKLRCLQEDHVTPFNTRQNFLFCGFGVKQEP